MKIFIQPSPRGDRGIARVVQALEHFCPPQHQICTYSDDAEFCIYHAIGRNESIRDMIEDIDKPYALIQYAIRSTQKPHTKDWLDIWNDARVVWSYYNLVALCEEDGTRPHFSFYHSPLGTHFEHEKSEFKYIIASSGIGYLQESVRECMHAAWAVNAKSYHVGPQVHPNLECSNGMSDEELMVKYSQCAFVSGLRRNEGFEYPVIEGLMCGARPVCFDRPHYRQWFHDLAEFIPEGDREEVKQSLINLFLRGPRAVTPKEKEIARERFSWEKIISNFYRCL
jgi:hypothetical protein